MVRRAPLCVIGETQCVIWHDGGGVVVGTLGCGAGWCAHWVVVVVGPGQGF